MKHHTWYKKLAVLVFFVFTFLKGFSYEDGIRIAWDFQTAKFVTTGVYARVHAINNNQFALVYADGPDAWIRISNDQCVTWSNRILVHHETGYNSTNSELVKLANGWLIYGWNGRPLTENNLPYIIKTKISKDNGQTWGDERLIYLADNTFENGCWEPALMQLPSGEVQLFFANENPYRNNTDQEIALVKSFDNGLTWGNYTTTCYRGGHRDGMPVPIRLNNNKGMVYCIEDNGLNGLFKPAIIYTSNNDNWGQGAALWNSNRRWGALRNDYALTGPTYAGAPYITQLPSGETILSVQSAEGRTGENQAMAQIYIGTDEAKDFSRKSTPMPWLPASGSALWNSLVVLNDSTVLLTTSVNAAGAGANGVWTVRGRVIKPMHAPKGTVVVDGIANEAKWNAASSIFIGSQTASNLNAKISYDDQNLYILCDVKDNNLWAESPTVAWDDDGIEIYLDPTNKNCNGICDGMYKLLFNIGGGILYNKVNASNVWDAWSPQNVRATFKTNGAINNNTGSDVGYVAEITIPWNQIGGKPQENNGWGIHFKLHDDDDGGAAEFHEDLSGNDPNKASTYMKASLEYGGNGTGLSGFYHAGKNFETPKFCRVDNSINFNWGNGSPDPQIPIDNFSVKWIGNIQVPVSGEYIFYIDSDNGRRLKINNTLVIDQWIGDWGVEYSGKITLQAGVKYPIQLDYFEEAGGANILFQWSHASIPKSIVSTDFLYPDGCGCAGGDATLDTDSDGTADCVDTDDDNDGIADADDCAPLNPVVKGKTLWYADVDGDGFGNPAVSQLSCSKPTSYVADKTDVCPTDPNKKQAGNCGCGNTEQSCLDCAGVANGTAVLDNCQTCVGGTTGRQACIKDCHNDWGGTAIVDVCNQCAGGNTGITVKTNLSQCTTTGVLTSNKIQVTSIPQPFETLTTIESTTVEITALTIVDATGNVVYQKTGLNVMKIEVGETLTNGMYTAIVQTESGASMIKILKLK